MNKPTIVPNTFTTTEVDTGVYRSVLKGTVQVEFEGNVYTVPATRMVGVEVINASGFLAKGKTGKTYPLCLTYRPESNEQDCRVGGGIVKIASISKE